MVEGEPVEFSTEYDERKRKAQATCVTGPDLQALPGFSTAGYTMDNCPGRPKAPPVPDAATMTEDEFWEAKQKYDEWQMMNGLVPEDGEWYGGMDEKGKGKAGKGKGGKGKPSMPGMPGMGMYPGLGPSAGLIPGMMPPGMMPPGMMLPGMTPGFGAPVPPGMQLLPGMGGMPPGLPPMAPGMQGSPPPEEERYERERTPPRREAPPGVQKLPPNMAAASAAVAEKQLPPVGATAGPGFSEATKEGIFPTPGAGLFDPMYLASLPKGRGKGMALGPDGVPINHQPLKPGHHPNSRQKQEALEREIERKKASRERSERRRREAERAGRGGGEHRGRSRSRGRR